MRSGPCRCRFVSPEPEASRVCPARAPRSRTPATRQERSARREESYETSSGAHSEFEADAERRCVLNERKPEVAAGNRLIVERRCHRAVDGECPAQDKGAVERDSLYHVVACS